MKTNARLLKQSSDKDDMNAKSLSTILHLKQRNEELEKENDIVKQKAQAAQQLSLAARLASNAKDRVGEEALKEKEVGLFFLAVILETLYLSDLTIHINFFLASRSDRETVKARMPIASRGEGAN
jgi:hypothetical protein